MLHIHGYNDDIRGLTGPFYVNKVAALFSIHVTGSGNIRKEGLETHSICKRLK